MDTVQDDHNGLQLLNQFRHVRAQEQLTGRQWYLVIEARHLLVQAVVKRGSLLQFSLPASSTRLKHLQREIEDVD